MRSLLGALFALTLATGLPAGAEAAEVVLYKDPACSCCSEYADYLRANGFEVTVVLDEDLMARHAAAGTPEGFEGCHLSMIEGYVVEGHVPVSVIGKLLDERPEMTGITLPGMPEGSPGMGGEKTEPFVVYGFGGGAAHPVAYAVD
jgi:hypothetical protein